MEGSKNNWNEKYLEYIKGFRMIDDDFMKQVFEDKESAQELLRIVTGNPKLELIKNKTEYVINNLVGKGIRPDVYSEDTENRLYDTEIQRAKIGASRKRARFNSSMLDATVKNPGKYLENLPETYVIFITETDVIGEGKSIYHIERMITETGKPFNDGEHIIYVNASTTEESAIGDLMRDFFQTEAEKIKNPVLSDRVKFLKETEKGVSKMCKAMEELRAEAEKIGKERGIMIGEERGIMIGEARGEARGKERGIVIGEARGIRLGRKDERIRSAKTAARTMREAGVSEEIIHATVARILRKAA